MRIEVVGCRILVKPYKLQEHDKVFASAQAAGIALPEMTKRKEEIHVDKGVVLQIGESAHADFVGTMKVGDVIGYTKFGGKFFTNPETDELLLVINDEDVVCLFKE